MHCLCDMHCQSLLHTGWTVSFSKQKVEQGDTIYRKEYSSLLLHGHQLNRFYWMSPNCWSDNGQLGQQYQSLNLTYSNRIIYNILLASVTSANFVLLKETHTNNLQCLKLSFLYEQG